MRWKFFSGSAGTTLRHSFHSLKQALEITPLASRARTGPVSEGLAVRIYLRKTLMLASVAPKFSLCVFMRALWNRICAITLGIFLKSGWVRKSEAVLSPTGARFTTLKDQRGSETGPKCKPYRFVTLYRLVTSPLKYLS